MIHSKRLLFVFLILWTGQTLTPAVTAWAQTDDPAKTVQVIGTVRISRDDVARARDEAISQGLWRIVEKGVDQIIPPSSIVRNFQLLSDRVYSRPEEFIHDYKVLTESKTASTYRVVIQATLMTEALQGALKDLGVLTTEKKLPSMLFLLTEQNIETGGYRRSWEQDAFNVLPLTTERVFHRLMSETGVIVIKSEIRADADNRAPADSDGFLLTDSEAVKLGAQMKADIVVIGRADAGSSGNVLENDMKSVQATFHVRALKVDDGTVMGTFDAVESAVGSNETASAEQAFKAAATAVAEKLNREVVQTWGRETNKKTLVELLVQGIEVYNDFVRFRKVLKNEVRSIDNVYLKAIKAREAKMDIELQGDTRTLADELMQKSFESFGINIFEIGPKHISLELIPKTNGGVAAPESPQKPAEDLNRKSTGGSTGDVIEASPEKPTEESSESTPEDY